MELGLVGLRVAQQRRIEVYYRENLVEDFVADLLVEECVIVEIKAIRALEDIHTAQCVTTSRQPACKCAYWLTSGRRRLR